MWRREILRLYQAKVFHMILNGGLRSRHIAGRSGAPGLFSGAFVESVKFGEASRRESDMVIPSQASPSLARPVLMR